MGVELPGVSAGHAPRLVLAAAMLVLRAVSENEMEVLDADGVGPQAPGWEIGVLLLAGVKGEGWVLVGCTLRGPCPWLPPCTACCLPFPAPPSPFSLLSSKSCLEAPKDVSGAAPLLAHAPCSS